MAAGVFTPSQLLEVRMKAEQMWTDSRYEAEFVPYADAAKAVLENQTARFAVLNDIDHDNEVRVTWINACSIEVEDCESNCTLDEPELESGSKLYKPDLCKKTGFSVDAEKTRTNDYGVQEIAARGLAKSIKQLDEWWARQTLAKIKTFAGVNVAPAPWTYDATDKTTYIPEADFNVKIVANMLQQAYLNKMGTPYFINNGSLFIEWLNRNFDSGNMDGKGDAARMAALKMYFDQFNFAGAGLAEDTFMISPGAMAMQTTNRNPDAPTEVKGNIQQTRYTVPSIALPGVKYDAYYALTCKTVNGREHLMHTWRFETNGGVWLNPEGCPVTLGGQTVTPTGILSYTQGDGE